MTIGPNDKVIETSEATTRNRRWIIKQASSNHFYSIIESTDGTVKNPCLAISDEYKTTVGAKRWAKRSIN